MLIWFMNKIYLFFILVCCVQSYLLPFSCRLRLRFSLPLIKITARIDNRKRKETDKGRGSKTTNHRSCFLRGQVCCTDYWQQNGVRGTVCLGLNFRTRPHSTLRKKEEKNKILRSTCGKCSFSKNSNRINIRLWNRG